LSATAVGEPTAVSAGGSEQRLPPAAAAALRSGYARARRRRRPGLRRATALALDLVAALAALLLAAAGGARLASLPAIAFLATVLAVLHRSRPAWHDGSLLDDLRQVVGAASQAVLALAAVGALTGHPVDADAALHLWLPSAVLLTGVRPGRRRLPQLGGTESRPTLIVGAGRVGSELAARLTREPWHGLQPVGFLDEPSGAGGILPTLGTPAALDEAVAATGAECVVIAFTTLADEQLLPLLEQCERLRLRTLVVPRLYEADSTRTRRQAVGLVALAELQPTDPRGVGFAVKHLIDRLVAAVALLVLAPLLAVVAVLVKVTSTGPFLYRQRRVGRDGHEFTMLKFRTMRPGEERRPPAPPDPGCAPGGIEPVDRRTRLGALLRRSSLDELPQLLNVLRGDMSLIGPRPERPEYVRQFVADVAGYERRHRVKSGITGLAQVSGLRGPTSLAERTRFDNAYIQNWSYWLDFKIAVRTIKVMLTLGGG
jgi:exopolysaccharide biosynthesis polyprenyl glycosylphosphotransferase